MSFEVPEAYKYEYRQLVLKAQPYDVFDVVVSTPKRARTTGDHSQNHHLNGHCQQIANETGNDFADVKSAIKRRAFRRGLRYKSKETGEIIYSLVDGEPEPISEADMTIEECAYCIEEAHILADELAIRLREE